MTRLKKMIIAMMLVAAMILPSSIIAATVTLDPERTGSISVTIKDKDGPVSGGSLTLYQVATMSVKDGAVIFTPTTAFKGIVINNDKIASTAFPQELTTYITNKKIVGTTINVDRKGNVLFDKLPVGLYLIRQEKAADNYNPVNSFVITLPMEKDGKTIYDIDASPKVEVTRKPGDKPDKPGNPPSVVPQTGQLWWPVPLLAFAGLLFLIIGFYRRRN